MKKYKLYSFYIYDSEVLIWSGTIACKNKKKVLKKLIKNMPGHSMYKIKRLKLKNFKITVERINK